jgi:hypothetical protein
MSRTTLFAAAVLATATLSACSQAPPQSVLARTAYEMEERCGRTAWEWFNHQFPRHEDPLTSRGARDGVSYENHYNAMENACFALVSGATTTVDGKTGKAARTEWKTLDDVNRNRRVGKYSQLNQEEPLLECAVRGKPCTSPKEWDELARPYMEW